MALQIMYEYLGSIPQWLATVGCGGMQVGCSEYVFFLEGSF